MRVRVYDGLAMNKNNAAQYLPLVQALAEGKTLEYNSLLGWENRKDFDFTASPECYRIKPEPREFRLDRNSWVALGQGLELDETIRVREILD